MTSSEKLHSRLYYEYFKWVVPCLLQNHKIILSSYFQTKSLPASQICDTDNHIFYHQCVKTFCDHFYQPPKTGTMLFCAGEITGRKSDNSESPLASSSPSSSNNKCLNYDLPNFVSSCAWFWWVMVRVAQR